MTNEERNVRLYEKMQEEQLRFHDHLITLPPGEILKNAYRYSVQEDILFCLENNDLTAKQCYALLSLPNPLAAVYEKWEASDHRLLNHLMDTIRATANEKLRQDYIRLRREAR